MLIKLSLCISLVIIATTAYAYNHTLSILRQSALTQLTTYTQQRSHVESIEFNNVHANLKATKELYLEEYKNKKYDNPDQRFNLLFEKLADGSTRSRKQKYINNIHPATFIGPQKKPISQSLKKRILLSYDISQIHSKISNKIGVNTIFVQPENALTAYWPDKKLDKIFYLPANYDLANARAHTNAKRISNPNRIVKWTNLRYIAAADDLLIMASLPIDIHGKHISTIAQPILVGEFIDRTIKQTLKDTFNVILHKNGQVIAHPHYIKSIKNHIKPILAQSFPDKHLNNIYKTINQKPIEKMEISTTTSKMTNT